MLQRLAQLQALAATATSEEEKSTLQSMVQEMKKNLITTTHPYKVSWVEKENRFSTHMLVGGKRKCIKAKTEEELYKKLWDLYGFDGTTLHDLFFEWFEYKKPLTSSTNTTDRYTQYFHKYLETSPLATRTVQKVTKAELETECNRLVKDHNLTRKAWQNLKGILSGMYAYAVDHHYITENFMQLVRVTVRYKQVTKKPSSTEVLNREEYADQKAYFTACFEETKDPAFAAVLLQDMTGLRIGELVALKWSDLHGSTLMVEREEVYDSENPSGKRAYRVVPHTKTYITREVYLPKAAVELLASVPCSGEFIFSRGSKRVTSRQVTYQLEKYYESHGLPVKRSHKNRKTYASNLAAVGVEVETIRRQLGHADLRTTYGYIYETSPDHSASLIDSAV